MTSSLNKLSFFSKLNQSRAESKSDREISIHWFLTEKDGFERVVRIIQEYYDLEGDHSKGLTSFYKSLISTSKSLERVTNKEDADCLLESFIASEFASNTNYFEVSAGLEENLGVINF